MNEFVEVFVFTQNQSGIFSEYISDLLIGFAALAGGLYLFWNGKRNKEKTIRFARAVIFIVVGVLVVSTDSILYHSQAKKYSEITNIYNSHSYSVVEGKVNVIHEESAGGHDIGDVILVNGTKFVFSYYIYSLGYHQTISHDGVLKDGVIARLTYYNDVSHGKTNNVILKVEVLKTE